MSKHKRAALNETEEDAYFGGQLYNWKPGTRQWWKRRVRKRERKQAKQGIRKGET